MKNPFSFFKNKFPVFYLMIVIIMVCILDLMLIPVIYVIDLFILFKKLFLIAVHKIKLKIVDPLIKLIKLNIIGICFIYGNVFNKIVSNKDE